jgi:hypothetical protein
MLWRIRTLIIKKFLIVEGEIVKADYETFRKEYGAGKAAAIVGAGFQHILTGIAVSQGALAGLSLAAGGAQLAGGLTLKSGLAAVGATAVAGMFMLAQKITLPGSSLGSAVRKIAAAEVVKDMAEWEKQKAKSSSFSEEEQDPSIQVAANDFAQRFTDRLIQEIFKDKSGLQALLKATDPGGDMTAQYHMDGEIVEASEARKRLTAAGFPESSVDYWLAQLVPFYSPDQPRDEKGQWAGSGSDAGHAAATKEIHDAISSMKQVTISQPGVIGRIRNSIAETACLFETI